MQRINKATITGSWLCIFMLTATLFGSFANAEMATNLSGQSHQTPIISKTVTYHGDLTVNATDTFYINDTFYRQDGNVTVLGKLIIRNSTFEMLSDLLHIYNFKVNAGIVQFSNSTLTTDPNLVNPYIKLNVTLMNNANVSLINSVFGFPGTVYVSGSSLSLVNSRFRGITPPAGFTVPQIDDNNGCPQLTFADSKVYLNKSRIDDYYKTPTPLKIGDVNVLPSSNPPPDNTGQPLINITMVGSGYYDVASGKMMYLAGFSIDPALQVRMQDPIVYTILKIIYHTGGSYSANDHVNWTIGSGNYTAFTIKSHVADYTDTYNLTAHGITTMAQLMKLHIAFMNNDSSAVDFDLVSVTVMPFVNYTILLYGKSTMVAIDTYFDIDWGALPVSIRDSLFLSGTSKAYLYNVTVNETKQVLKTQPAIISMTDAANGYVYRFVTFYVTDSSGIPLPGVMISPNYTGGDPLATKIRSLNVPRPEILAYLGKKMSNYNVTDSKGLVTIPIISDNVTQSQMPNSMFYGDYYVKLVYSKPKIQVLMSYLSLSEFPLITASENRITDKINMTNVVLPRAELYPVLSFPSQAVNGTSVTINATVHNSGGVNASNVLVRFFDGSLQKGKQIGNNITIPLVAFGSSVLTSVVYSAKILGSHNITVVVDPLNKIPEMNKTNNSAVSVLDIITPSDIAVFSSDLDFNPSSPAVAESKIVIEALVRNLGDVNITNAAIGFYTDNSGKLVLIQNNTVNVTAKGSTLTQAIWTPVVPMTCTIVVWADPANLTGDRDRSNNMASSDFVVTPTKPDFYPQPIFFAAPIVNGTQVMLRAWVYNVGKANATNVMVRFYEGTMANKFQIGSNYTIPFIGSKTMQFAWTNWTVNASGTKTLTVVVDPDNTIPEENKANNSASWLVQIIQPADLAVDPSYITFVPPSPIIEGGSTVINATVFDYGDVNATDVPVFAYTYDGKNLHDIGNITINVTTHSWSSATIPWNSIPSGAYTVLIWVDPAQTIFELIRQNNKAYISFIVNARPDLIPQSIVFDPSSPVVNRTLVNIAGRISNLGGVRAENVTVQFFMDKNNNGILDTGEQIGKTIVVPAINSQEFEIASMNWSISITSFILTQNFTIGVDVNHDHSVNESNYNNNVITKNIEAIDTRPDIELTNLTFIGIDNKTVVSANLTNSVTIKAQMLNINPFATDQIKNIKVVFYDGLIVIGQLKNQTFNATEVRNITMKWVAGTKASDIGIHKINIIANPDIFVVERTYKNDVIAKNFTIIEPGKKILWTLDVSEVNPGDLIPITGVVEYNTTMVIGVPNVNLTVTIVGLSQTSLVTNATGWFSGSILAPNNAGQYVIIVSIRGTSISESNQITVNEVSNNNSFIWMIAIIVIIIVVISIIGAALYLRRTSKERMVECGECGALIPEASKKCPKCGTLFEATMARCSNCKSWIPSAAKECPECGVVFVKREKKAAQTYEDKMKIEYNKSVEKYKAVAKRKLGKKYSEEAFWKWWKDQPTYISFKDWLVKEEERIKKSTITCPSCQTLNPKTNANCQKCGTLLVPKAEPQTSIKDITRPIEKGPEAQSPATQKCIKCGEPLESGTKFCTKCGAFQGLVAEKAAPKPQTAKVVYKKVIKPGKPADTEILTDEKKPNE